jgi:diguanylate cyclase (GGDEF)-like protein
LQVWNKTALKSLVVPGGVLLLGVAVLAHSGWVTLALPAVSFLYYCALIGGMLLAWRFHSSRIFCALIVLFLAQQTVAFLSGAQTSSGLAAMPLTVVLVPLNFVFIALMQERGLTVSATAPIGLFLFAQSVVVAVLYGATSGSPALPPQEHHFGATFPLSNYALFIFAGAGIFLLMRFLLTHKPVDSAMLWSLFAFFLSLRYTGTARVSTLYLAASAGTLAESIIENSYLLAYHDELTMLPSRRAFNEALLRLHEPYSIAVVDIDHFKRFNDTYGHDTGDQVLRLVAASLSRVTGGGQAYRCGGEEFTILFPGKTTVDVVDHVEQLRATIESSEFRIRGGERRRVPRGPERRTSGRLRKGRAIRQLKENSRAPLSVTVSIGVATSTKENGNADLVLQAADKALYRAKANGRNRVETASAAQRRRVKAAGIA